MKEIWPVSRLSPATLSTTAYEYAQNKADQMRGGTMASTLPMAAVSLQSHVRGNSVLGDIRADNTALRRCSRETSELILLIFM